MSRKTALAAVSDTPDLDVALLLCHCLAKPRSYLFTWPERVLTAEQQQCFDRLLARREGGEPIAHILGQREFWSLGLEVSPATLIPRGDTECLVERALQLVAPLSVGKALDLGAGTGAIALALAHELPGWQCLGVDVAIDAVELARRNALRLGLANASFAVSDWFDGLEGQQHDFDLIVSNPPYIAQDDPHLSRGDLRFEPQRALVAGPDGLADLRRIIRLAPDFLRPAGWLVLEHGYDQADAVAQLLQQRGFQAVECSLDYGGNPRVSVGCWGEGQ